MKNVLLLMTLLFVSSPILADVILTRPNKLVGYVVLTDDFRKFCDRGALFAYATFPGTGVSEGCWRVNSREILITWARHGHPPETDNYPLSGWKASSYGLTKRAERKRHMLAEKAKWERFSLEMGPRLKSRGYTPKQIWSYYQLGPYERRLVDQGFANISSYSSSSDYPEN